LRLKRNNQTNLNVKALSFEGAFFYYCLMNNITHEYHFLRGLFEGTKKLKPLKPSWNSSYLLRVLLFYLALDLVLNLIVAIPLFALFEEYFDTYQDIGESTLELLFYGVILAPILEELMFRMPLKYRESHLKVYFIVISLFFFAAHWSIGLLALATSITLATFSWKTKFKHDLAHYHKKYSREIFWVLTSLFALVHIFNYTPETIPFWVYPFMVIPQFISGFLFGIVRIRFGLRYSMLLHACLNLILISMEIIWPS